MTTNQENRHQDLRDVHAFNYTNAGDWHAYWDDHGVSAGTFNERMLEWINDVLSSSYTNVSEAMSAFAEDRGVDRWSDIADLQLSGVVAGDAYLLETGDHYLLESGDKYLLDGIAANQNYLEAEDGTFLFTESGLYLEID